MLIWSSPFSAAFGSQVDHKPGIFAITLIRLSFHPCAFIPPPCRSARAAGRTDGSALQPLTGDQVDGQD